MRGQHYMIPQTIMSHSTSVLSRLVHQELIDGFLNE